MQALTPTIESADPKATLTAPIKSFNGILDWRQVRAVNDVTVWLEEQEEREVEFLKNELASRRRAFSYEDRTY